MPTVFVEFAGGGHVISAGAADVLAERRRQIEVEGWTAEHDDKHAPGAMAAAAGAYCESAARPGLFRTVPGGARTVPKLWPKWALKWFKPTTPRQDLVKACALCLAEIERIDRADAVAREGGR